MTWGRETYANRCCSHGKLMDDYCAPCDDPYAEFIDEIAKLKAEVVVLKKDADRYRWLRDRGYIKFLTYGEEINRIVDVEMAKPDMEMPF